MTPEEFDKLTKELEKDTRFYSGHIEIMEHPNFIKMQKLGPEVMLPYLIDKLNTDPHWWLFLLFDEMFTQLKRKWVFNLGMFHFQESKNFV